ncbi:MAG: DUF4381 domain-containing protein [Pseudomonadota bacterium]
MNPQSIANLLEPLRSPDAVSWWPPAPGWWVLAALLLLLLAVLARWLWRFYRRGAPLRSAKLELAQIRSDSTAPGERIARLTALQRRTAIRVAGRRACAGLTGTSWVSFLNSLAGNEEPCFDDAVVDLPYRREVSSGDLEALVDSTQRWLLRLERPR